MTGKNVLEPTGPEGHSPNHPRFLETLLDTIPNPVFYKDANGVYQGCNEAFACQILGLPMEKIVGRSLCDLPGTVPAELAELYHQQDIKLIRASGTQFYEAKVKCADGVIRDFLFNKATFNNASGEVAGMIGIMVDITERKRTEERFVIAAGVASDLIYEWNVSDDSLEWFGDIDSMLGYDFGELSGTIEAWVARIHPEDRERLQNAVKHHKESTDPIYEEYRIQRKDGTWLYWIDRATPVLDNEGRPYKWIGVCSDISERKRAETALKESQEKWRSLVENSPDIILNVDRQGTILLINHTVEGIAREEAIGTKLYKYLPPDDHERVKNTLEKVFCTGVAGRYESTGVGPQGSMVYYESRIEPVRYEGAVVTVNLIATDITKRKQAEASLRESEERYRSLIQNLPIGLYRNTPGLQGRFIMANPCIARMFGYDSVEEFLGISVADLYLSPDERKPFSRRLLAEGEVVAQELRLRKKDGTPLWGAITARVVRDPSGKVAYYDGLIEDISERKRVEEELRRYRENLEDLVAERTRELELSNEQLRKENVERMQAETALLESEERFRALTESTSDWIWELDVDAVYTYASPKVRELLGYDPEEVVGKTPFDLMCPEEANHIRAEFGPIAESQRAFAGLENKNRHKDGRIVVLETSGVPIFDGDGIFRGYRGIDRDITERKRTEHKIRKLNDRLELKVKERTAELEKAYNELKELDRLKDSFLSIISHELRTPLTSIRSFSEILLLYDDEKKETQREFLEIINSESQRLTRLVNDVLDLSKIEANCMVYHDDFVSLDEIIRDGIKAQQQLLQEKSLHLAMDLPPGLPTVFADRDRILQVVTNLMSNAIKFSSKGGTIQIRVETFRGRRTEDRSEWVRVSVSDEGIGIHEKDFKNIFNKFHQVATDALKDRPKGTGLGLPICKEIISHYQGNVFVESEEGKGSTFFFTLPVAKKTSDSPPKLLPVHDLVHPETEVESGWVKPNPSS